jgi:hypothetical protein
MNRAVRFFLRLVCRTIRWIVFNIANPKHEEHDRMLEWAGDFDPEEFDAGETTKAMRRGLPDWRQM